MLATSAGCAATDARLADAAGAMGRTGTGIALADLPDDCRRTEPHAPLVAGAEMRSTLARERAALDRQNARAIRCAGFHDQLRRNLAQAPQQVTTTDGN